LFGEMTAVRSILVFFGCLAFAGKVVGAESSPPAAEQFVGRWESTSFATTNCIVATNYLQLATIPDFKDLGGGPSWLSASLVATNSTRETNLIICVYEVTETWIDPTTSKRCAYLDTELHFTDHSGRERPIREACGLAILSDKRIEFHAHDGYSFSSRLTDGVWTLEKFAIFGYDDAWYKVRVKAALNKASSEPGERLTIWRAESGRREV
jgi:hypothetical protein